MPRILGGFVLIGGAIIASVAWGTAMSAATITRNASAFLYGPCPYPLSDALQPAETVDYARFDAFGPGRTFADL